MELPTKNTKTGKIKKSAKAKKPKAMKTGSKVLSDDQKKQLAQLVQDHPEVWSLRHPLYKKTQLHVPIWTKISESMNLSVADCKRHWRSIRDALRYQLRGKKLKVRHSGDSGDEASDSENYAFDENHKNLELESWNLYESVKFLLDTRGSRQTIATQIGTTDHDETIEAVSIDLVELGLETDIEQSSSAEVRDRELPKSNYNYATKKRKLADDNTDKLATGIQELINLRKDQTLTTTLKYQSMYANLDRMLTKLPEDEVEDLNIQFITLIREKMKSV